MALDIIQATTAGFENLFLSKNRIEINIDPASLLITDRSKLRYYLQLLVAPYHNAAESDFVALPEMEAVEEPFEQLGSVVVAKGAYFEVSNILHSILEAQTPGYLQNKIVLNPNAVRSFKFTARVENNGIQLSSITSSLQRVFRGGVNEKQIDGYATSSAQKLFSEHFGLGNEYLTYCPTDSLLLNQPQYLSVLINQVPSPTKLKLRVLAEYDDNTVDANPSTININKCQAFAMYSFAVGPLALGLLSRSKKVVAYTIWLTNQADAVLTAQKRYTIDSDSYPAERFIVFRNSLSAYETLACVGKVLESIEVTREVFDRNREYDSPATFTEKITNKVTAERQLVVNTGWLNTNQRTWLEELVLSEEILLQTDRGLVPLTLIESNYLSDNTDEDLIGRAFTFKYANTERSYSNLPPLPSTDLGGTAWRAYNTGACELDSFGKRTGKRNITHLELYYSSTNAPVKPAQVKLNTPETDGYLPPQTSVTCTPNFLNEALSQESTFRKTGCANGFQGSFVTLSIAADLYGSEVNVADANAKALAVMLLDDTQAYANANGLCNIAPWAYTITVPANRLNIRWVMNTFYSSIMLAGGPGAFSGLSTDELSGNHWICSDNTNPNSLAYNNTNNSDMLVKAYGSSPYYWIDSNKACTITVYKNGTLFFAATITQSQITNAGGFFRQPITGSNNWLNLDKIYIDIVV
jgi:Family of unknown function (DUF5977)